MQTSETGADIPIGVVRRARAGDPHAVEALIRALYPLVSRWSLVKTGHRDDAQDVTQEVMIRISKYVDRFDDRSRVTTWAYQITSNAVVDLHRRTVRRREHHSDSDDAASLLSVPAVSPDAIDDAAATDLVHAFLRELPAKQREVFDLADLQGYRSSEVGEMLGISPTTVRGHLFRARRFIRRKILETNPKLVEAYGREL